jgi:hypothetical protein
MLAETVVSKKSEPPPFSQKYLEIDTCKNWKGSIPMDLTSTKAMEQSDTEKNLRNLDQAQNIVSPMLQSGFLEKENSSHVLQSKKLDSRPEKTIVFRELMPFSVKSTLAFSLVLILIFSSGINFVTAAPSAPTSPSLPPTVSSSVTKVVAETLSTNTGETVIAQDEVSSALSKLIQIYEKRVTRLQDEVNRLRIENEDLRTQITNAGLKATSIPTPALVPSQSSGSTAPKTPQEKRYDAIVSNVVVSLPEILKKNSVSASGSIGLFEFIEPKNFFISIDNGLNPAGVTAFKTKILFEYDANLNLKIIGVFELDYPTQRYVTVRGNNPFSGVTRIRVKNPNYAGRLLDEPVIPNSTGGTISATASSSSTKPTATSTETPSANATVEDVRKAYDKNKLGDAIELANSVLAKNPNNIEVLTMRARSQYIFSKFDSALGDIATIYKIQGDAIDCGIVNDGARAEKALKGAKGSTFSNLQTTKCKK